MSDVIIIGGGPAGLSAAIYSARAGLNTLVIAANEGTLEKVDKIENYFGFEYPIDGKELVDRGIKQAKRFGVKLISEEVTGISYNDVFVVKTGDNKYESSIVILATGSTRNKPKIADLDKFEGKGVSYCSTCDGFFYRGKTVAIVGSSKYALSEALELKEIVKEVIVLTNGEEAIEELHDSFKVITSKIKELSGDSKIESIEFEDGTSLKIDGMFIAMGTAGGNDFAKSLGILTKNSRIVINENMETNIPGMFAAGDCTGGLLQVSKAVYEGAKAGTEAAKYYRTVVKPKLMKEGK